MVVVASGRTKAVAARDRELAIPGWDLQLLGGARVLLAGVGTEGSVLAATLALAGVGTADAGGCLTIVDLDRLEEVNVSRWMLGVRPGDLGRPKAEVAAERVRELNPAVNVQWRNADITTQLGRGAVASFDGIAMCVDNLRARQWLSRTANMWPGLVRVVVEGGIRGHEWVVHTFIPGETACYECMFVPEDYGVLARRQSCTGLGEGPSDPVIPMSIVAAVPAAGLMAQELIQVLLGREPAYAGRELRYAGDSLPAHDIGVPRRKSCPAHEGLPADATIVLPMDGETTVGQVKSMVAEVLSVAPGDVSVGRDTALVTQWRCGGCGGVERVCPPRLPARTQAPDCPACRTPMRWDPECELVYDELTLREHLVPDQDILEAHMEGREFRLVPASVPLPRYLQGRVLRAEATGE